AHDPHQGPTARPQLETQLMDIEMSAGSTWRLCHSFVRQEHQELGAMRLVWFHQDSAAVRLHDCAADRQTHTEATFLGGEERLENLFAVSRLNTDARITYL